MMRLGDPFAGVLAGRIELDPRTLGEPPHAEIREHLAGAAQLPARIEPTALSAQPFAIQELGAGECHMQATMAESADRLAVEGLGRITVAQQRARARLGA